MKIERVWAMPSADTFSVKPIGELVKRYIRASKISVDPFSRNKRWATFTNDLNPKTMAEYHMEAADFLSMLRGNGFVADLVIFDPPYSPRQVSECYSEIGIKATSKYTQAATWTNWKNAIDSIVSESGLVITCGWNTNGMGIKRGYSIEEILIVPHGAAHNDTLVTVERKNKFRTAGLEQKHLIPQEPDGAKEQGE